MRLGALILAGISAGGAALIGCEVISGLNELVIVDGGVDATPDALGGDGGPMPGNDGGPMPGEGGAGDSGGGGDGGGDGGASTPVVRPLGPISTAVVTTLQPYFSWLYPTGAVPSTVSIDICSNHACDNVVRTIFVSNPRSTTFQAPTKLSPGAVFWRVNATVNGVVTTTAVWELWAQNEAPVVRVPTYAVWGSVLDVNADGFTDTIVGAPGGSGTNGAAFLYLSNANGPISKISATILPPMPMVDDGSFATAVASVDFNGDGIGDVAIGSPAESRVYFYAGTPGGLASSPSAHVDWAMGGRAGIALSNAGDVNGDGYGDVVVGAPGAGAGGEAFVIFGDPTTPRLGPSQLGSNGTGFGSVVSGGCDFDRDGYGDIAVGAPADPGGGMGTGSVTVYYSDRAGGLRPGNAPIIEHQTVAFGSSVACVGDVDGDGYGDLAVGDPLGGMTGQVFVFQGASGGVATNNITILLPLSNDTGAVHFGASVSGVGDLNTDGYDEIAIGSPKSATGGRIYVAFGTTFLNLGADTLIALTANGAGSGLGTSLAGPGDVENDGKFDIRSTFPMTGTVPLLAIFDGQPNMPWVATTPMTLPGRAATLFGSSLQ